MTDEEAERERIAWTLDVLLELTASLIAQEERQQRQQPPEQPIREWRRDRAVVIARERRAA